MSITQKTFDSLLQFADGAAAMTASGAAEVSSSAQVLDLGSGNVHGDVVVDVSAIKISANDEIYTIYLQLSSDADFGTAGNIHDAAAFVIGAKEALFSDSDKDGVIGRYLLGLRNDMSLAGVPTTYRYARLYAVIGGTSPSITFSAYLAKQQPGA